jgi:hypothetical protein
MADNETTDDLRSILSQSFDDSVKPEAVVDTKAIAETPKADAAGEADTSAKDETRERGADGKFVKKTPAEEEADAKAADAKGKEKPDADKDKPKTEADKPDDGKDKPVDPNAKDAPANWSASDKAMFALQTPEAKDFLLRRHRQMQGEFDRKSGEIASLKKEFGPIEEMFKPHLDVLKAKGLTPAATIRAWANVETALANGRGVDIVKGMIDSYRIDKAAVARALGFTSGTAAEPSTDATKAAADPASTAHQPIALPPELTEELRQLRARLDAQDTERRNGALRTQQEKADQFETEIQTFKSATNEKGELLHPYYDEVEPAMLALAQSYVASKQPLPKIADLYDTAVWANPSTRDALLATREAAKTAKATEEARAKAASARRAGSSITGAPGSGQIAKPIRSELSLREAIEEAAADSAA